MGVLQTGIHFQDQFSTVLMSFIDNMTAAVRVANSFSDVMNQNINTGNLSGVRDEIRSIMSDLEGLNNQSAGTHMAPTVSARTGTIGPSSANVPVTATVAEQPQIEVPETINVPVTATISEQPQIEVPETINVPVTATVAEQPQIEVPETVNVPVTATVAEQPQIEVPEAINVPVTATVAEQPQIEVPETVNVPVTTTIAEQPQIEVPETINVPVTATVAEQPQIEVPETVNVPVTTTVAEQPQIEVPETINVPVTATVAEQPQIEVPEAINVPVTATVAEQPQIEVPEMNVEGVQQFNGQITQTQALLQRVSDVQQSINSVSQNADIIPDSAGESMERINYQLRQMRESMNQIAQNPFNLPTSELEAQLVSLQGRIHGTLQEQLQLSEALSNIAQPPPVQIPVEWQTDNIDVFTSTGVERFRQEVQSANTMLEQLGSTQDQIARQAFHTNVLPPSAFRDMNSLAVRIDGIRERIGQIEANPLNLGTGRANSELERLRTQLSQAVAQQNEMNSAISRMDVHGANSSYLQLSQTISNVETHIRDNINEQGQFNSTINEGRENANGLLGVIKGAAAAYLTLNTVKSALNTSDELVQTTARINLMNDDLQTTDDLVNMVYLAAQDARGSFSDMSKLVARFGNNAKDAFSSSEEVVQFVGLIQKQMTIAGATAQEAANAELQLSQALGSGVLRGEELNSVFEQAPNIIQNIADYLDVDIGKIREMAQQGEISADVVKQAIFAATDEINTNFDSMPMTWEQTWTSMENTAIMAFRPVLQKINDIANSEQFQVFTTNAINTMALVAGAVLQVFELIGNAGQFFADNWSLLSPIILGTVAALAVYGAYLAITKGLELVSAGTKGIMAVWEGIHAAAIWATTGATWSEVTAQNGLNAAMYACPIVWVIILIIALVAAFYAAVAAINKFTGTSISATGVICGAFMVGAAFIGNQIVAMVNFIIDNFATVWNFIVAFVNFFANVFTDPVGAVARLFFDLVDTVLSLLESLASAIDTIFRSNLADAVSGWRDSLSGWVDDTFGRGTEVLQEVNAEDYHLNSFEYGDAWDAGYDFGKGIEEEISNFNPADLFGIDIPQPDDYVNAIADSGNNPAQVANDGQAVKNGAETAKNTGDTAKAAQKAAQALDVTAENLKYIKDMAERDYINRFTTAKINIKQTNHNKVNNNMDLDGINEYLRSDLEQRLAVAAEGVH